MKKPFKVVLAYVVAFSSLMVNPSHVCGEERRDTAPLKIDLIISQPCSMITFMDTISGRHHTTGWLKDWYWKKRTLPKADPNSNSVTDKSMIDLYTSVMDSDISHDGFIDVTGRRMDLNQYILSLAADSRTLPELYTKMQPVLKSSDFQNLKTVLEYFAPIYDRLVWQPRLPSLQKQLEEYRQEAVKARMSERLTAVQEFLKAPWIKDMPFTMVLVPLPAGGRSTHGESLGRVQIVEAKPDSTFERNADVVFHEAVHALWFSKKDRAQADKLFVTANGEQLPLTELYEGMATALGQGCFPMDAFGKTDKSWYGDKTINDYAHQVYPLYVEYLKSQKVMDAEFCRRATDIYYKRFPEAERDMHSTSEFLVLADQIKDLPQFKSDVYKALPRMRDCSICAPIDASESLKAFKSFKESSAKHAAILTSVAAVYKLIELGLKSDQIQSLNRASGPVTLEVDKKQLLFCIADAPLDQQKMLLDCLHKSKWPEPSNK